MNGRSRNLRIKPKRKTRRKYKSSIKHKKIQKLDLDNPRPLNKKSVIIGVVYAKWCPHCKDLIPEEGDNNPIPRWQQTLDLIKQRASKNKKDIYYLTIEEGEIKNRNKLAKFNEKCKDISDQKLDANGYPTLFKITDGKLEKYTGPREPENMANWFTNL
jgi:thiol-disulfide isomerase/thioredoxin